MMGKDCEKDLSKGLRNFTSGSSLTIFIKEFIKFDTLIKVYFHENKGPVPEHEKAEALKRLASNLKITKGENFVAHLCRKLKYLMESKVKYLLNRCKAGEHPLEYALLMGPRWLREAEPRIQMLPIMADQMVNCTAPNNNWSVWELNTELIQNAIKAIKNGVTMTNPVVVQNLSNTNNIESFMILQHWIRSCNQVRQTLHKLKASCRSAIKGENKMFVDWTIADFLIMYDTDLTLVSPKTLSFNNQLLMLHDLYTLTSLYNIEELLLVKSYSELYEAWIKIYTSLTCSVINLSLVYLQRIWHELKYQARIQMLNYIKRGKQLPVPDKLLRDIVARFKRLLHDPFPSWSSLVDSNLVVQIKKFGERVVPVPDRPYISHAGPSRTYSASHSRKQIDKSGGGNLSISTTNDVIEVDSPKKASCTSVALLNNIDPSKATVRLIFESDSDEETIDASETGSTHDILDLTEFEEHTNANDNAMVVDAETVCVISEIDTSKCASAEIDTNTHASAEIDTNTRASAEIDTSICVSAERDVNKCVSAIIDTNKCASAEIHSNECVSENKDTAEPVYAQINRNEYDGEEIQDKLSVDIENHKTELTEVVIESTESIDVVETQMNSNNAQNITQTEIATNEQTFYSEVDIESTEDLGTEVEVEDEFAVDPYIQNEASDDTEVNVDNDEYVSTEDEDTSEDDEVTDDKLLMIPIVLLQKCDHAASWKQCSKENTFESSKRITRSFPPPAENTIENLPNSEMKITEEIPEKPAKTLQPEMRQGVVTRSSRRLRGRYGRRKSPRIRSAGESQIISALSTMSKEFLENDHNIRLLLMCKPLNINLVRLPGRTNRSPCIRTAKKVELPDINQVRKINSTMLTAEVAPVAQVNKYLRVASTPPMPPTNDSNTTESLNNTSTPENDKNLAEDDKSDAPPPLTVEPIINDQVNEDQRNGITPMERANDILKNIKTNVEHCKEYCNRRKAAKAAARQRAGLSPEKPKKKPGSECYLIFKPLNQTQAQVNRVNQSSVNQNLPSTSMSGVVATRPSPTPVIVSTSGPNHPDVAIVPSGTVPDHDGYTIQSFNASAPLIEKNLPENGKSNSSSFEEPLQDAQVSVVQEIEKAGVKRSTAENIVLNNRVSVIVDRNAMPEKTVETQGCDQSANIVKLVSEQYSIMESTSSVKAPCDKEHRKNIVDEEPPMSNYKIIRIVRSTDNGSVPSKDDANDPQCDDAKRKKPNSVDGKNSEVNNGEDNVRTCPEQDNLKMDRKRKTDQSEQNTDVPQKRIFVDAYEEWLKEKNVTLKYFKLPNIIKPSETSRTPPWKIQNPSSTSKIPNMPQVVKVLSHSKVVGDQPTKVTGVQKQCESTVPLLNVLKAVEMQSPKEKEPIQSDIIDLTAADEPVSKSSNRQNNQQNTKQKNIQQNQTVRQVPNSGRKNVVNAQSGGRKPQPIAKSNPVASPTDVAPMAQLSFVSPQLNSAFVQFQSQPCQYQPINTLVVTPMVQPSSVEAQYPYIHLTTLKSNTGECYLLMPTTQTQTEASQPVQKQCNAATTNTRPEKVVNTLIAPRPQPKKPPRTPYITITPKVYKMRPDNAMISHSIPSKTREEAECLSSVLPPIRTYSKSPPSMKILRVDSSKSQWALCDGKKLVVTTGDVQCTHPTYWSVIPNKERTRILFPGENNGVNVYNPPATVIDKPQDDNTPFSRWLRTVFPTGPNPEKGNTQPGAENEQVAQDPKPAARIKVKSFARMTDEVIGWASSPPDRVSIRNQLYQKYSDRPLAYAEMLTVLPDFATAKSLIAAKVPVFLLNQSEGFMSNGLSEINKQNWSDLGGEFSCPSVQAAPASSDTSSKISVPTVKLAGTVQKTRPNPTSITIEKSIKILRNSIEKQTNLTGGNIPGISAVLSNDNLTQPETIIDNELQSSSSDSAILQYVKIHQNVNIAVANIDLVHGNQPNTMEYRSDGSMVADQNMADPAYATLRVIEK